MTTLLPSEVNFDHFYSSSELCTRYGITPRTLARWAKAYTTFPKPTRVLGRGRNKYYKKDDVHKFEASSLTANSASS